MKSKLFSILLTGTFLTTQAVANTVVNSYEKLSDELNNSATADVTLDMNGQGINLDNISGVTITKDQRVTFLNIDSWSGTSQNVINQGVASFNNVVFKNNDIKMASGNNGGGGIIKNINGYIAEINNVTFDNNKAVTSADLWGGVINNKNGVIDVIKDSVFSNNFAYSETQAPHGGVIFNNSDSEGKGIIKLIDNVTFENNSMTSAIDKDRGAHGVAIDNNVGGVIEKITNSKFISNKVYRTGEEEKQTDNYHASAGGLDNYGYIGEISNTIFQGNSSSVESVSASTGSGAIMNIYATQVGATGRIDKIINVKFINNYTQHLNGSAHSGALSTMGSDENGRSHIGAMENILFQGNYAQGGMNESSYIGAYGGALVNSGYIGSISGKFINNHVENTKGVSHAYGGAIDNTNINGEIGTIKADFTGNYSKTVGGTANGGAINNRKSATIGDIIGDFSENYSISETGEASAGAIMQLGNNTDSATISSISGNFRGNYAKSSARATGGAINNNSYAV
ncbi:MAG: hypothetical protein IKV11_00785, partial [Alphaproteobacteria bacterium]|nr:hypothetical protein [Alphaproteobacteria bacterium]